MNRWIVGQLTALKSTLHKRASHKTASIWTYSKTAGIILAKYFLHKRSFSTQNLKPTIKKSKASWDTASKGFWVVTNFLQNIIFALFWEMTPLVYISTWSLDICPVSQMKPKITSSTLRPERVSTPFLPESQDAKVSNSDWVDGPRVTQPKKPTQKNKHDKMGLKCHKIAPSPQIQGGQLGHTTRPRPGGHVSRVPKRPHVLLHHF